MHRRNREKRNDIEHHEKASFFYLAEFQNVFFSLFLFWNLFSSLHMLLVMLFIHVGKRSNGRSLMFFKTGVLKNVAMYLRKHLCWSLFLI